MPDVVTPFDRKQLATTAPTENTPRHRRDGYFDENDQWHNEPGQRLTVTG